MKMTKKKRKRTHTPIRNCGGYGIESKASNGWIAQHEERCAWPKRDEPDGRGCPESAGQMPRVRRDTASGQRTVGKT